MLMSIIYYTETNIDMNSLQKIQDFYESQGLKSGKLRKALEEDKEYQRILSERKASLRAKLKISKTEERKYVLSTDDDYEILSKIKQLEKSKLPKNDKEFVTFIKTQLEQDWRKPLLKRLNRLLKST